MSSPLERSAARLVGAVSSRCVRWRWAVLALFTLVAIAAGHYTVRHVAINTDTADMLAASLPWRVAYADFKEAFPYFTDTLVVVVDAATPDLAREAAQRISRALARDAAHFSEVFEPVTSPFFRRHQLLYLSPAELERLVDELSGAQALLGRLADDPGLNGFLDLLGEIADAGPASGIPVSGVLSAVRRAIDAFLAGDRTPMSWQSLLLGSVPEAGERIVFTVKPRLDYGTLLPAEEAIGALRAAVADLGYAGDDTVSVRLTGGAALGYDELYSVVHGSERAAVAALVMVTLCLIVGLRSLSLVVATLFALVVGLALTACFATLAVGTLNMISVAFAVLYVGLGVDFAIHLCLRYRELCDGRHKRDALLQATRHIGVSLALCALTTALGFLAFMPTSYRGVAELGLISAVGICIGLAVSLSLLPALLEILPAPRRQRRPSAARTLDPATRARRGTHVLVLAGVLAAAALTTLPAVRFDHNPLNLNDPQAESVTTFSDLEQSEALYAIDVVRPDRASARALAERLERLPEVASVVTVEDLIPDEQASKLALLDELRLMFGEVPSAGQPSPLEPAAIARRLDSLARELAGAAAADPSARPWAELAASVARLHDELERQRPAAARAWLAALERKLMHHFPQQLDLLAASLEAEAVTLETLPRALRERWVTDDGRARLEVRPARDLDDNVALARFVDAVRALTGPDATGRPVINIEASSAVTTAFVQAFAMAGLLVTALLYTVLRRVHEVLVVLAPLVLAGLLTTAVNVIIDMPFNFANIIALPLLLGIGIDSALHIMHRYKTTGQEDVALLASSSARAVLFSALTTAASFGNLATSPHAGTASMGLMLTVGLALTLVCTLVVLPALLHRYVQPTGSLS